MTHANPVQSTTCTKYYMYAKLCNDNEFETKEKQI